MNYSVPLFSDVNREKKGSLLRVAKIPGVAVIGTPYIIIIYVSTRCFS